MDGGADRAIAAYQKPLSRVRPRLATFSAMLAPARPRCRPCAPDRDAGVQVESLPEPSPTRTRRTRMRESTTRFARSSCTRRSGDRRRPGFATETDSRTTSGSSPRRRRLPCSPCFASLGDFPTRTRCRRRGAAQRDAEGAVDEHEEMIASGDDEGRRLAQTGDRVVVLLRRLRFNYGGSLSAGRIELSGHVIALAAGEAAQQGWRARPRRRRGGLRQNLRTRPGTSARDPRRFRRSAPAAAPPTGAPSSAAGRAGWGSPGAGRGAGSAGSDIDFFGRRCPHSNDSGDSGEYSYRPNRKSRWVNTGWDNDEKVDDCMIGELTRIITKDASGDRSGSFDSGSGDSGSGDVRYSRDGDW